MARMFNPPHPGLTLRDDVLPALGLSVTEAAEQLGVSRVALSRVINGNAAISPELAIRLEAWLGADRGGAALARRPERLRRVAGTPAYREDDACEAGAEDQGGGPWHAMIKDHARIDLRMLFGALIAVALGLAGLMAKGCLWL